MAYDHAATKMRTRRIVHTTFAISMEYSDKSLAAPIALRVRYHNKQDVIGDLQNEGYPMSIDGIDRVIFDVEDLVFNGISVTRGGKLKVTQLNWPEVTLLIETKEKSEGPVEEIWRVVKA